MKKKINAELERQMKEIEKLVESDKSPRELITLRRKRISRLGGAVKKYQVPFKKKLERREKLKVERTAKREAMRDVGISLKKRRR